MAQIYRTAVNSYLQARMKAIRPNRQPNSQKTKQDKIICGMNVFLESSALACPLPITAGSTICSLLASRTT